MDEIQQYLEYTRCKKNLGGSEARDLNLRNPSRTGHLAQK